MWPQIAFVTNRMIPQPMTHIRRNLNSNFSFASQAISHCIFLVSFFFVERKMLIAIVIDVVGVTLNRFLNISCILRPFHSINSNCRREFIYIFLLSRSSHWLGNIAPHISLIEISVSVTQSHFACSLIHVSRFVSLQNLSIYWMGQCNLLRSCLWIIYRDNTADSKQLSVECLARCTRYIVHSNIYRTHWLDFYL